jgi:hypothetical protein
VRMVVNALLTMLTGCLMVDPFHAAEITNSKVWWLHAHGRVAAAQPRVPRAESVQQRLVTHSLMGHAGPMGPRRVQFTNAKPCKQCGRWARKRKGRGYIRPTRTSGNSQLHFSTHLEVFVAQQVPALGYHLGAASDAGWILSNCMLCHSESCREPGRHGMR